MKLGWRIPSPRLLHKSSNQIRRAVSKCSLKQIRRSASRLRGKYNAKSCMRSQRSCHGRDFESRDVTSKTHSMSSFQSGIPTKSMKFVMLDHSKASTDSPTPETRQMFFNILVFETGAMRDPATPWNAHATPPENAMIQIYRTKSAAPWKKSPSLRFSRCSF